MAVVDVRDRPTSGFQGGGIGNLIAARRSEQITQLERIRAKLNERKFKEQQQNNAVLRNLNQSIIDLRATEIDAGNIKNKISEATSQSQIDSMIAENKDTQNAINQRDAIFALEKERMESTNSVLKSSEAEADRQLFRELIDKLYNTDDPQIRKLILASYRNGSQDSNPIFFEILNSVPEEDLLSLTISKGALVEGMTRRVLFEYSKDPAQRNLIGNIALTKGLLGEAQQDQVFRSTDAEGNPITEIIPGNIINPPESDPDDVLNFVPDGDSAQVSSPEKALAPPTLAQPADQRSSLPFPNIREAVGEAGSQVGSQILGAAGDVQQAFETFPGIRQFLEGSRVLGDIPSNLKKKLDELEKSLERK